MWSKESDIYSAGMVFYEIVSLQLPFSKFDDVRTLVMILQGYREPIPEHVPINVKKLIEVMWSPNYHKRPTSRQVIEHIKELQENTNIDLEPNITESKKEEPLQIVSNLQAPATLTDSNNQNLNKDPPTPEVDSKKEESKHSYEQKIKIMFLLEKYPFYSESEITS